MSPFGTMPIPASTRRMLRAARVARFLLVLWSAVAFALSGGPGAHAMGAAQTLVSVIICSDDGPQTVLMDMGGGPAEHSGDCNKCASCVSHHLVALTPPGLTVERSLARRRAGEGPVRRLSRSRTISHFHATGPPASKRLSDTISYPADPAAGEASPGLTIVNTNPFRTWQGSGRSAKEACR